MKLRSKYMGLQLNSPIVVSACTLSEEIDNIVKMEDCGAGAVVMYSLFEEQIRLEANRYQQVLQHTSDVFAEASDFFPNLDEYHSGTDEYLEKIRLAKQRVDIPIIASLNGISINGWIDYSKQMQEAGADAIEINIFFIPGDMEISASAVEHRYLNILTQVKNSVKIPVAVKLNPYFSSMGNMATRLQKEGADALVLFNRFYQPDFDIETLTLTSNLQFSEPGEIRLPLLWISMLHGRLPLSLAASTGVNSATEVIKYLLAGADVTMTASSLYKHGISYLKTMNKDLDIWMYRMGFLDVDDFRGSLSQQHVADLTAYERANYIRVITSIE
ncbi:MAG: dihydroorotate dehydrogenase-like protein [Bacteroidota bacterium]